MRASRDIHDETLKTEIDRIFATIETQLIEAGERARALAERYPDSVDAWLFLGFVRNRQRDVPGALESLEAALEIAPQFDAVHFNLGVCKSQLGRLEEALTHFLAAAEYAPNKRLRARVLAGCCHHRLGRPGEALTILDDAVAANARDASALYASMRAAREIGDFEGGDRRGRALANILRGNYDAMRQLLGFFQGYDFHGWLAIDDKAMLQRSIERYREDIDPAGFQNVPETFVMPEDHGAAVAAHRADPGIWMVKPNNLHNGHGLRLIEDPVEAPREAGWILQRYLTKPFLFRRRKASFRLNFMVTSTDPPRVYLHHGGSARFALDAYEAGNAQLDNLPMHIGHRGIFGNRTDLIEETARVMGNSDSVWGYAELARYIQEAGGDTEALWLDLQRQAEEVVDMMVASGLFADQAPDGCRFAYGPKIFGLDIFLDETLRPWVLEVERGPTFFRMFNGERENNPVFPRIGPMIVFPWLGGEAPLDQQARDLRDPAVQAALEADIEYQRRGDFIRLLPREIDA